MRFGRIWTLRGPNLWSQTPAIEAEVDVAEDGAVDVPALARALALDDGALRGTTLADLLYACVRRLQEAVGFHGVVGGVHATRRRAFFRVVFDYDDETLADACLQSAFLQVEAARTHQPFDVADARTKLLHLAHEHRLGPSTLGIVKAAQARGIPVRRLTSGSLVQLG